MRPDRVAHHVRGYNPRSIGIELVNTGRYPHWRDSGKHQAMDEPYPEAQIVALLALLIQLQQQFPSVKFIAGHEDLDREMERGILTTLPPRCRASAIRGRCSHGHG